MIKTISLSPMIPIYTGIPQNISRALLIIIQSEGRNKRSIVFYGRVLMQELAGYGSRWAIRSFHRESPILFHASPFFRSAKMMIHTYLKECHCNTMARNFENLKQLVCFHLAIILSFSKVWMRDEYFGFSFHEYSWREQLTFSHGKWRNGSILNLVAKREHWKSFRSVGILQESLGN